MSVKKSTSYGIIPLIKETEWKCFLLQHRKNEFWGFPKGHAEPGETHLETAQRELYEETGLKVIRFLDTIPLTEQYTYLEGQTAVEKTVHFYLALTTQEITLQSEETLAGRWLSLTEAHVLISYPEGKELLKQVTQRLNQLK